RPEHRDGLSALDEQRLVAAEPEKRRDDLPESLVAPRCAARAAVHDEPLGVLGDLGVEVVQEHPEGRLRLPGERVQRAPTGYADRAQVSAERVDARIGHASAPTSVSAAATTTPARIASATSSMSALSDLSSVSRGERVRTASCTARTPAPGWRGARNSIACAP